MMADFQGTKLSQWRGSYPRLLRLAGDELSTLEPGTLRRTNGWPLNELLAVVEGPATQVCLRFQPPQCLCFPSLLNFSFESVTKKQEFLQSLAGYGRERDASSVSSALPDQLQVEASASTATHAASPSSDVSPSSTVTPSTTPEPGASELRAEAAPAASHQQADESALTHEKGSRPEDSASHADDDGAAHELGSKELNKTPARPSTDAFDSWYASKVAQRKSELQVDQSRLSGHSVAMRSALLRDSPASEARQSLIDDESLASARRASSAARAVFEQQANHSAGSGSSRPLNEKSKAIVSSRASVARAMWQDRENK